jgi:hypothetical protein
MAYSCQRGILDTFSFLTLSSIIGALFWYMSNSTADLLSKDDRRRGSDNNGKQAWRKED